VNAGAAARYGAQKLSQTKVRKQPIGGNNSSRCIVARCENSEKLKPKIAMISAASGRIFVSSSDAGKVRSYVETIFRATSDDDRS
jgi:hypothetical protein